MRPAAFSLLLIVSFSLPMDCPLFAQERAGDAIDDQSADDLNDGETQISAAPSEVDVDPLADDGAIETRLTNILAATAWFDSPQVKVDQGVVFLKGVTNKEEYREWASDLAGNTQDVVAVVNRIRVTERSVWDLSPASAELRKLGRETVQMLPLMGVALALVVLSVMASSGATKFSRWILARRMSNRLLISVTSRAVAIPVFLVGLYLALRVSGLTQMAATVLGGTGLIGLVLGIAFRDIAENFLASVLISVQRPFATGDLIEVQGHFGIVQSVTVRGTLLMTLDGNHIQIPNASIYKSIIRNVTANPNLRSEFVVGIDYGDSIAEAQSIIFRVLREHEAVLDSPDPMVLVDELGASTVNLRIYFWLDGYTRLSACDHVREFLPAQTASNFRTTIGFGGSHPDAGAGHLFRKGIAISLQWVAWLKILPHGGFRSIGNQIPLTGTINVQQSRGFHNTGVYDRLTLLFSCRQGGVWSGIFY